MTGYVYLFRQCETNYVKIGMTETESVTNRFTAMQMYSPKGAEIIAIIPSGNPRKLEKELHNTYAHCRLQGEFFELTDLQIWSIKNKYVEKDLRDAISKAILRITEINEGSRNLFINRIMQSSEATLKMNDHSDLFDFVKSKFENKNVTTTKIHDSLPTILKEKYSLYKVGRILKDRYQKKSIKTAGDVRQCWVIK